MFTAWLFSRRPNLQFIGASHTSELADDFSGKIHRTITDNQETLGYGLRTEAKGRWYTTNGGGYLAAGVRGAIPGFRADGVVIDDPIKGRAAADSPTRPQRGLGLVQRRSRAPSHAGRVHRADAHALARG